MAIRINDLHSSSVHTEYAATYSNNVISLTNAGDNSPVFIFTAPVDYVSGTTFNVNGIETPATMIGGEPLPDGAFVTGDVLIVSRGVNGINFRLGGGGEGLNYSFQSVASEGQLPVAASKNRMYIISDIPLPASDEKFEIGSILPSAPQPTGKVFIRSTDKTDFAFNGLIGSNIWNIYPEQAYQWDGTAWQQRDGYIDRENTWEQFSAFGPLVIVPNIIDFPASAWQLGANTTVTATQFQTISRSSSPIYSYLKTPINLNNYNTLQMVCGFTNANRCQMGVTSTLGSTTMLASTSQDSPSTTLNLNISNLTGTGYLCIFPVVNGGSSTDRIFTATDIRFIP